MVSHRVLIGLLLLVEEAATESTNVETTGLSEPTYPSAPLHFDGDPLIAAADADTVAVYSASRLVYVNVKWSEDGNVNRQDFVEYLTALAASGASELLLDYDGIDSEHNATQEACKSWEELAAQDRTAIKARLEDNNSRIYMSVGGETYGNRFLDFDPVEYGRDICVKAKELLYDGVNWSLRGGADSKALDWWRTATAECAQHVDFVVNTIPFSYLANYVSRFEQSAVNERFIIEYFASTARYDTYRQVFEHDSALHMSIREVEQAARVAGKLIFGKYTYRYGHDGTMNINYLDVDDVVERILEPADASGWYHGGVSLWRAPRPDEEYGNFITRDLKRFAGVKMGGTRPKSPLDPSPVVVAIEPIDLMTPGPVASTTEDDLVGLSAIETCRKTMLRVVPTFWLDFCQQMCTMMGSNPDSCLGYNSLFECINGKGASCKGSKISS